MAPRPRPASPPPSQTNHAPPNKHKKVSRSRSSSIDLNILSAVLGDRLITPWYPSLFREELIGPEPVERLYVCPRCFKYCAEVEKHVGHLRFCDADTPGHIVYSKEPYAIYELDGEEQPLFTQNLSLFAKLFIENKSVCFDVNTFLYYLLVLDTTSPLAPLSSTLSTPRTHTTGTRGRGGGSNHSTRGRKAGSNANTTTHPTTYPAPRSQIVGFFSKEKLSWDNNNLACILVFPPWQKTGLGQLLMGASYEISRREGRLGGPERPLSALGRASYLAYWSRAVAREVLAVGGEKKGGRVSVAELGERTWMLAEDVVAALAFMGVVVGSSSASSSKGTPAERKAQLASDAKPNGVPATLSTTNSTTTAAPSSGQDSTKSPAKKEIKYRKDGSISLDKARVREWIARGNVDVRPVVDPGCFVGAAWGEAEEEEEKDGEEGEEGAEAEEEEE